MKKSILFLIVFLSIISINATHGAYFVASNERTYHYNRLYNLELKDLAINSEYSLLIGNNSIEPIWNNFTTTTTNLVVIIKYDGPKYTSNNESLIQLYLHLYLSDTNQLLEEYILDIEYAEDWFQLDIIQAVILSIFPIIIITSVVLLFKNIMR